MTHPAPIVKIAVVTYDYVTCRELLFLHGHCNTINPIDGQTGEFPTRCRGCNRPMK